MELTSKSVFGDGEDFDTHTSIRGLLSQTSNSQIHLHCYLATLEGPVKVDSLINDRLQMRKDRKDIKYHS